MKKLVAALVVAFSLSVASAQVVQSFPYIYIGHSGVFKFIVNANGQPLTTLPAGYTPQVAWTCTDTTAQLIPSTDSTTVTVNTLATDTATSLTLTATAKAPDGTTITATYVVPLTVEPVAYTAQIQQLAASQ